MSCVPAKKTSFICRSGFFVYQVDPPPLACSAMALVISVGITSALGYPYTPMHAALPFLALGKCTEHCAVPYVALYL